MKRIVFKNTDGTCGVIIPAPKALQIIAIEDIAIRDVPKGLEYRITDTINLPTDRDFRNTWTDDNPTDTVDVDMAKARVQHMDRLRYLRNEKLKALDSRQYGSEKDVERQALRDLPATLDLELATTPEELKEIMPEVLVVV